MNYREHGKDCKMKETEEDRKKQIIEVEIDFGGGHFESKFPLYVNNELNSNKYKVRKKWKENK